MQKFDLNGTWHLVGGEYNCDGTVPGSVYSFLLENKLISKSGRLDGVALTLRQHESAIVKLI